MATLSTFSTLNAALGVCMLIPEQLNGGLLQGADAAQLGLASALTTFLFQYHPAKLSISEGSNYEAISIPGGSQPIDQWISGTAREISFTAEFTSERINPPAIADFTNRYNIDINSALALLRSFKMPAYSDTALLRAQAPQRLRLVMPNTHMLSSTLPFNVARVLLTNITEQIMKWHVDGTPRHAEVNLSFRETVQSQDGVKFYDRTLIQAITAATYSPVTNAAKRTFL